jgi:putative membrane protein
MRRAGPFALGLLALAASWSGLFEWLLPGSFAAHMAMHMGVVAVAAPLLAMGLSGGRYDPVCAAPGLFPPLAASVAELIAVWAWHAPALHHFARHELLGLLLEQSTFLATGFWVWMSALGGSGELRSERAGQGCLALVLTSMHMTLLGALLALPPRPLYGFHAHSAHGSELSAIDDQHLGGAIMLTVGGLVYLAGGLALVIEIVRRTAVRPQPAGLKREGVARTAVRSGPP